MSDRVEKGNLAEYAVISHLLKKRFKLAKPLGTDWRYDLILVRDNRFERIQTKWCSSDKNKLVVNCRSTSYSTLFHYTSKDIDWLAAYDEKTNKCFFIPSTFLGEKGRSILTLRYNEVKHANQYINKTLYAKDFEEI